MTVMKRAALVLALALVSVIGLSSAPATASPTAAPAVQAEALSDCTAQPYGILQLNDSFECLGAWQNVTVQSFCTNMNLITTPGSHPAPNGWSNSASSLVNWANVEILFYDAFNCDGPVLFAMDPFTIRERLNSIANNKASSYWAS